MVSGKKYITTILLLITIGVWSIIIIELLGYITCSNDDEISSTAHSESIIENKEVPIDEIIYIQLVRDPFTPLIKKNPKPVEATGINKEKPKTIQKTNLFDYKIIGIIVRNEKQTVILEDISNNSIIYLGAGDKYKNVRVISIDTKNVKISENDSIFTINFK